MDGPTLIEAARREGEALHAAGCDGLDAPVPSCPGWVVGDVLGHVGRVYCSVAEIIERRATEIPPVEIPRPPAGAAVLAFYQAAHERLVAALRGIEPDEPVYSWSDQGNGAFYLRRMAHETAVHRWDAQSAHGVPDAFDSELAADAVDEFYGVVLPFSVRRWSRPLPAGSLHVHRDDGPGEWLVREAGGAIVTTRVHDKGDVAVRGRASDLLLYVWNRGRSCDVQVFGDAALADAWAALAP